MANYDLLHDGEEIDACIDEVVAARGSESSLSAALAAKQDALSASQLAAANSGITAAKLTADEAALVELYGFIFGLGTALSSGDNLNSLTYSGRAYASTGTIAASILNTPWAASGFTVWTMQFIAANNFIQILIPNTSGGKWYKRRCTSNAWGSWTEYDGTQVAANQSASPASMMQAGRLDAELTDTGTGEEAEER